MKGKEHDLVAEDLSVDAIQEQLARVLGPPHFSRADKLAEFLSYVVEETLAGGANRLKSPIIAQAVYERGSEFEPQSDPLVRVEAGRLRGRLGEYYAKAGINDPILIEIPKGAYVPRFSDLSRRSPEPNLPEAATDPDRLPAGIVKAKPLLAAAIGGLTVGVLATWLFFEKDVPTRPTEPRFTEEQEAYAMFLETRSLGRRPYIEARVLAAIELARATQALAPSFGGG